MRNFASMETVPNFAKYIVFVEFGSISIWQILVHLLRLFWKGCNYNGIF
jgi:hypothetical protein